MTAFWLTRLRQLREDDRGSILPMVLGGVIVGLLVIAVVAGATAAYQLRKQLFTAADGAALAAAESFELGDVQVRNGHVSVRLTNGLVQRAAARHLAATRTDRLDGFVLVAARTPDGRSAEVTVQAVWRPPIISPLLPDGIPITVTARARTVFD